MKFILLILIITSTITHANDDRLKLCLTGSTEKVLPNYGSAFLNGVELAKSLLPLNLSKLVDIETYYYDTNPLGPLDALKEIYKNNCDAIIGFSTGNDLVVIEDQLAQKPIVTISIYGDPLERFSKTSYLRTLQPSAKDLIGHLTKNLPFKLSSKKNILIVTASDRSEMISYREAYINYLKLSKTRFRLIDIVEQTQDISSVLDDLRQKNNQVDALILLARSQLAANISDLYSEKNRNLFILGTKYFGSRELPAFYNFLKNKNIEAYYSRQNCWCEKGLDYLKFKTSYINAYKKEPMLISSESFDVANYLFSSLSLKKRNADTVRLFLNSNESSFKGVGSLIVDGYFKFRSEKKYLIKVDAGGYREKNEAP
jgi:hypothetical protein